MRLVFLLLLFSSTWCFAQEFTNHWIDYTKPYLKIEIREDGLHTLNKKDVQLLGAIPEKAYFTILHHGKYVPVRQVGFLKDSNFILEFYAEKNHGERDSLLYRPINARLNPYHSLLSDKSAYFLTWEETPKNILFSDSTKHTIEVAKRVSKRYVLPFIEQYSFNNSIGLLPSVQQSYFEAGEGWTGKFRSADSTYSFWLKLPEKPADSNGLIRILFNGRSPNFHELQVSIQGNVDSLAWDAFGTKEIHKNIEFNGDSLFIEIQPKKNARFDWYSLCYIEVDFQSVNFQSGYFYNLEGGFPFSSRLLEIKDRYTVKEIGGKLKAEAGYKYLAFKEPLRPSRVEFKQFSKLPRDKNFFIVSHPSLQNSAKEYSAYRSSKAGGSYDVSLVFMPELYDQFSFGERHPFAIRDYVNWAVEGNYLDKYLLLLGRAVSFPDNLKSWQDRDLVPTVGYPASDALLTAGLGTNGDPDVQSIATGRLNVTKDSEALAYLDKIKEYESVPISQEWKQKTLHLSGGRTLEEITQLRTVLSDVQDIKEAGVWYTSTQHYVKRSAIEVEPLDISKEINEGVGMVTFVGHGSANVLDLNIGYCSPPENGFNNRAKYPVMYFNGCGVGNIFYRYDALSTDWLLSPNKGAIAVFANSFWSYLFSTQFFLDRFYFELFSGSGTEETLGKQHMAANRSLASFRRSDVIRSNLHQLVLQGDPAIKHFPTQKPDYALSDRNYFIRSLDPSQRIEQADSIEIGIVVHNLGKWEKDSSYMLSIKNVNGKSFELERPSFKGQDTVFIRIANLPLESFTVEIKDAGEYSVKNNFLQVNVEEDWSKIAAYTTWPLSSIEDKLGPLVVGKAYGKLLLENTLIGKNSSLQFLVVDENPLTYSSEKVQLEVKKCSSCNWEILKNYTVKTVSNYAFEIEVEEEWNAGRTEIRLRAFDQRGNASIFYKSSFQVVENQEPSLVQVVPNPVLIQGSIRIIVKSPKAPENSSFRILSASGVEIWEKEQNLHVGINEIVVPKEELSPGVYIGQIKIQWANKEELIQEKFLVL